MRLAIPKGIVLVLVCPPRFARAAQEDWVYRHGDERKKIKPTWQPRPQRNVTESNEEPAARQVRDNLLAALFLVMTMVIGGWITGLVLAKWLGNPGSTGQLLQYGGVGVLLWATLAKGSWDLQTPQGDTLAERCDMWLFRILHLAGSYLLVLSVSWSSIAV